MIASKQETAEEARIWGPTTERALALITCVPTDDRNAVVFAVAESGADRREGRR